MTYRIQFDYSPVYELLLSFMIYSRRKWTRNLDIGNAWLKQVDDSVGAQRRIDVADWNEATFDRLFLLAHLCPSKATITDFLDWLSDLSPGQLYELLSPQSIGSLPSDLGEDTERSVSYLKTWNEQYFSKLDPAWDEAARADLAARLEDREGDPLTRLEQATGGVVLEPNGHIQDMVLVPALHFRPLNMYAIYRTLGIILYPVDPPSDPDAPPATLLRATRALSDESRLRILRFLAPETRSFTEVVAYTGLSKGTVHHHMMALRAAGLIRTHLMGDYGSQERFSIRLDGVDESTEALRQYMKG
ncbi:winged helix-turn-helix domain-containing protein [Paenibacillus sp. TRM 82003]|nr:winged helix-turn-helix domain-containing protein [Paenibacillus sp. TRM 82003]